MENKNTVPILEKTLDMLEYIGASSGAVTLPELQQNLGIAQASCYRIASTLVRRGWLEKCSGNRYEIAAGIIPVADKIRFRLDKYKYLQPILNRLVAQIGFSAKFSVRDGDEFVNVCSAQNHSELLNFSNPGFRSSLRDIASVSTIFLAESPDSEQKRLVDSKHWALFLKLRKEYRKNGFCFISGQAGKNVKYPFDTISFPVKKEGSLIGVLSFLSLPGILEDRCSSVASQLGPVCRQFFG